MKFDQYEVLCREDGSIYRMGQGPTSSSYKAMDTTLRTPVVLKVIRPELLENPTARLRFLREARAAALLRHPNVAQIYRMGEEADSCFYAREFIDGETLESRVDREGPLETEAALKVALQVADALVAVKEASLVHRDIKPSNLMITSRGEVKIIDFGLTKSNSRGQIDGVGQITVTGFMGSFDYASPEQLHEGPLDVASDIYSLGVTLWFLLTGRRPFCGPQVKVMTAHLHAVPPFEELSGVPSPVVGLLGHMLEKDAGRRPASPTELVSEINRCLAALKQASDVSPGVAVHPLVAAMVPLAAAPMAKKISPAREPARERSPRQFVLAELMVGTFIAVIVYLVLSRPVDLPASSLPTAAVASAPARLSPPPAAAHTVAPPQAPMAADPVSEATPPPQSDLAPVSSTGHVLTTPQTNAAARTPRQTSGKPRHHARVQGVTAQN